MITLPNFLCFKNFNFENPVLLETYQIWNSQSFYFWRQIVQRDVGYHTLEITIWFRNTKHGRGTHHGKTWIIISSVVVVSLLLSVVVVAWSLILLGSSLWFWLLRSLLRSCLLRSFLRSSILRRPVLFWTVLWSSLLWWSYTRPLLDILVHCQEMKHGDRHKIEEDLIEKIVRFCLFLHLFLNLFFIHENSTYWIQIVRLVW